MNGLGSHTVLGRDDLENQCHMYSMRRSSKYNARHVPKSHDGSAFHAIEELAV